jgi:hypothetical protein
MFTGLYRQTVTEAEHVKMIEVDSKSRSRLEIFSNLAKIQESYRWYLFEMRECPKYLRSTYVALFWAQTAGCPLGVAFSDHLACSGIPVKRFNTRDHTC